MARTGKHHLQPNMLFWWNIWKTLEHWDRKAVICCKQRLVDRSSRSLEDSNAESNDDHGGPAQEVLDNISNRATGYLDNILANNLLLLSMPQELA